MKKALLLVALLGLVGGASAANVAYFATAGYDAMAAADRYNEAEMDFLPSYNGFGGTISPTLVPGTHDLYIWVTFDPALQNWDQIYGNQIALAADPDATIGNNVAYRHNHSVPPPAPYMRWNAPNPLHFTDPGGAQMSAVTAGGVVNEVGYYSDLKSLGVVPALSGESRVIALLGVAEIIVPGGGSGSIDLGIGTLGVICHDSGGGSFRPTVMIIDDQIVTLPENPPSDIFWGEVAYFIPEPASLLLLGLAGLLLRRR